MVWLPWDNNLLMQWQTFLNFLSFYIIQYKFFLQQPPYIVYGISRKIQISKLKIRYQSSDQFWIMVGVVGNTSLLAWWHWTNTKFQQLMYCCWPNVGTITTHQRGFFSSWTNVGPSHACELLSELLWLYKNYITYFFLMKNCDFVLQE